MIQLNRIGRWMQFSEPIDSRLEKVISKTLSYQKPGAHFMKNPMWSWVYLFNSKKRAFPVGLISLVKPILEAWKAKYGEDYRIDQDRSLLQHIVQLSSLRDYQIDAFNAVWKKGGGLLCAPTGSGKTVIAERILAASGPYTRKLILVPSKDLKFQWEEELYSMINAFPNMTRVSTYQKIVREIQTEKGRNELNSYDIIIADETHLCAAKTFYKILMNCSNAKMIVGMTATPEGRSDGEDMKIKAAVGEIVYTIPIQKLTEQGYLTPARVNIVNIDKYKTRPDEDYKMIYRNGIVLNKDRNERIIDVVLKNHSNLINRVIFIYVDIIEHGEIILKMLQEAGINNVVFAHGNTKERKKVLEDVKSGCYKVVIGSKIYGTGVNVPKFSVLILAGGGKGQIKIIQLVGRMLRLNDGKQQVEIYDFADGCKNLKQHYNKRIDIYNKLGFEVIEE